MTFAVAAARTLTPAGLTEDLVAVVGDNGRIERLASRADGADIDGLEVVEFPDSTLLPGLVDMHAHPTKRGVTELNMAGLSPRVATALALRGVWNLRLCIDHGITTIRDVAATTPGIFELRDATESGQVLGPRMYACGYAVGMTGGHGWNQQATIQADGVDQVRTAVRTQIREGADLIKLVATGGIEARETFEEVQLSLEEMQVAVEEATRKRIHVAVHASGVEGVQRAVQAGARTIEHGVILDEQTVEQMVEHGTYYDPTLDIYAVLARGEPGRSAHNQRVAAAHREIHERSFRMAVKAGVKIIAGSDAGGLRNPLGASLIAELERMVEYGLPPVEAIRAATSTAAECLSQSDTFGSIAEGLVADLLVVGGDPTADITALRNVQAVFRSGQRLV